MLLTYLRQKEQVILGFAGVATILTAIVAFAL
jgi:hypothetical protein